MRAPKDAWPAGGFVNREIGQLDPMADVERRAGRVLDQVAWGRDPDQHERQTIEGRIGGALLVQEPNRREEIVGEIESKRRVDFVDEDDQALAPLGERHLPEIPGEPVAERGIRTARPTTFDDEVFSDNWSSRTVRNPLYHCSADVCAPNSVRSTMTGKAPSATSRSAVRIIRLDLPIWREVRM